MAASFPIGSSKGRSRIAHDPRPRFAPTLRRRWLTLGGLGRVRPVATRPAPRGSKAHATRIRSCVLFLLHGGPSQLDIWDMKPDGPGRGARRVQADRHQRPRHADHRAPPAAGPAGPPVHHRPVDDPLGRQPQRRHVLRHHRQPAAARADRLHADRERLPAPRRPGRARPARRGHVPTAVSLPDPVSDGPYTCPGQNGGFLGAAYAPVRDPRRPERRRLHRPRPGTKSRRTPGRRTGSRCCRRSTAARARGRRAPRRGPGPLPEAGVRAAHVGGHPAGVRPAARAERSPRALRPAQVRPEPAAGPAAGRSRACGW